MRLNDKKFSKNPLSTFWAVTVGTPKAVLELVVVVVIVEVEVQYGP